MAPLIEVLSAPIVFGALFLVEAGPCIFICPVPCGLQIDYNIACSPLIFI